MCARMKGFDPSERVSLTELEFLDRRLSLCLRVRRTRDDFSYIQPGFLIVSGSDVRNNERDFDDIGEAALYSRGICVGLRTNVSHIVKEIDSYYHVCFC